MKKLVWRLYHEDGRLTVLTIQELEGSYIIIPEELALEFQSGVKRFFDYLIYDNKLIDKPTDATGLVLIPCPAQPGNGYETLELDPSWLADKSINSTSRYELKWQK